MGKGKGLQSIEAEEPSSCKRLSSFSRHPWDIFPQTCMNSHPHQTSETIIFKTILYKITLITKPTDVYTDGGNRCRLEFMLYWVLLINIFCYFECILMWCKCVHVCGHTWFGVSIHVWVYGRSKLTLLLSAQLFPHCIYQGRSLPELGAHF